MDGGRCEFTEEFWTVMKYLGWGDPDAVIWTIGIEEAQPWCSCEDTEDKDFEYIRWKIKNKFNEEIIPVKNKCKPDFKIAGVVADIFYEFYGYKRKEDFQKCLLWKKGSRISNINIYPLGKASLSKSYPECYEKLFGLTRDCLDNYFEAVEKKRYESIRKRWTELRRKNNLITICYGISGWNEFKKVFKLEQDTPEKFCNGNILKYEDKRVILCPHLSRRFSATYKEEIKRTLTEWRLKELLAF